MTSITLITGGYPTGAPSTLTGKVAPRSKMVHKDVDVKIKATAASGVLTLIAWDGSHWVPIGDIALDASAYGGMAFARYTPGNAFSHFAIWEKTAGATVTVSTLTVGNLR